MSSLERDLAPIGARARALADRRVREMTDRLYADGAADRAVLGIPERVHPWQPNTLAEAWGAIAAAWQNAVDEFGRQFTRGFTAVRRRS